MQELHDPTRNIGRVAVALAIFALSACGDPAGAGQPTRSAHAEARAQPETTELPVPGHRPAVLVVPPGSGPHPVLVAAHGAGDRAEWQCEWWAPHVARRGFVLCPRGRAMTNAPGADTGYYFPDHNALGKEVLAALEALRAKYGERVDSGPAAYAGYSQGAIMGALFAAPRGKLFAELALIEGGYAEWDVPTAMRFHAAGGRRVLLACGQRYCLRGAERALVWLRKAGLAARLEHVPGAGHTYGGELGERVANALPWLFEDDSRWAD